MLKFRRILRVSSALLPGLLLNTNSGKPGWLRKRLTANPVKLLSRKETNLFLNPSQTLVHFSGNYSPVGVTQQWEFGIRQIKLFCSQ